MQGILTLYLACLSTALAATHPRPKRQEGPVDPSTAKDCTYWATATDMTYTCRYFEDLGNISHDDFVRWNPSVKSDCSGIEIGNSYCIEVNFGYPQPTTSSPLPTPSTLKASIPSPAVRTTTKPSGTTTAARSTTTGPAKPSPTQPGLVSSCTSFYKAQPGDSCWAIVNVIFSGAFTLDDFYEWNPAVRADCSGLQAFLYYCVGVPGTRTPTVTRTPSSVRPTPTASPCTWSAPASTQPGSICGCQEWHLVQRGDTCAVIVVQYGISYEDFLHWNSNVGGEACTSLWAGYRVCVGV